MPKSLVRRSKTVTCSLQTHRQAEFLITEYPIRASAFPASACDMSGPMTYRFRYPMYNVEPVHVSSWLIARCVLRSIAKKLDPFPPFGGAPLGDCGNPVRRGE